MTQLVSRHAVVTTCGMTLMLVPAAGLLMRRVLGKADGQNIMSIFSVVWNYRKTDFRAFMKGHREAIQKGKESGDYVPGVVNYYTLMSDLITLTSGPFWHFVPMFKGMSRSDCHEHFHHTLARYLGAGKSDKVLELGCGYGEMGRQVAKISGSSVTGLTMADAEIEGGNARIKAAGLEDRCKMVQGNYHKMDFQSGSFDKVFGVYTLKYSSDLETVFAEVSRLLKPGGTFLSYEILVTDKYDPSNAEHKEYVSNISTCTCMPPLWPAQAMRDAARKAGLVPIVEEDIGAVANARPWYTCFTSNGLYYILICPLLVKFFQLAEAVRLLPPAFSDWFENLLIHPAVDFVRAGRLEIISGTVMMTWKKA
eukprot:gb/GFBE01051840.1/.p1 GENE.gb/GFBE01051840.1/~~gb/GFBE01051840.1/.p1  ORF type:complete len:366 (+),score=97.32 gb/GFBE01051840.1/:1-1098(+)